MFFLLMVFSTTLAYGSDYKYAGRFVLRDDQKHNVDVFLLNHLRPYWGQPIYSGRNSYAWYDVYYKHDHSSDSDYTGGEAYNVSLLISGNVVPLNIKGEPMNYAGSNTGNIISLMRVGTKGAFGVNPESFEVYDRVTQKLIFEAKGDMGSEILYQDSALETILNLSGPHFRGSKVIKGNGYYPYS